MRRSDETIPKEHEARRLDPHIGKLLTPDCPHIPQPKPKRRKAETSKKVTVLEMIKYRSNHRKGAMVHCDECCLLFRWARLQVRIGNKT